MLCYLDKKTDETAKDFLQRRGRRSSPLEWNKSFPRTTSWRRSPDWERNGACPFRWIYVPLHLAPHHLELRLWIVWQGWGLNGQHGVFVSTALSGKPSFSRNIQVKFNLTFPYPTHPRIQIISWTLCSALQSRLKWESGYVAQRVNGEYANRCFYLKKIVQFLFTHDKFHLSEIPCVPWLCSLGWASPAYLQGFLFSCRPFCLWFWSFHNVGCQLRSSPLGHLLLLGVLGV